MSRNRANAIASGVDDPTRRSDQVLRKCPPTVPAEPRGPWLTVAQLTEYLALPSEGAVRELERRRVLPGHRLGGSLRFSRPEIDALLLKSRQSTLNEIAEGARVDIVPVEGLGPLLDPENASSYLGLPSVDALNHRVRRGEVPTYRVGRQLRFREAELDAAVTSRRPPVAYDRAFSPSQTLTHDRALLIDEGDARLPR